MMMIYLLKLSWKLPYVKNVVYKFIIQEIKAMKITDDFNKP